MTRHSDTRPDRAIRVVTALAMILLTSGCSFIPFVGGDDDELAPALQADNGTNGTDGSTTSSRSLQPGDRIKVTSWLESDLSGEYTVGDNGQVVLPLIGPREVTGIPAGELKTRLVQDYESKFRNHTVDITLLRRVSVLGAVREPGMYHVEPTMTVADAIALAGGPSDDGKLDEAKLVRDGRVLHASLDPGMELQAGVVSGDRIMVPKRNWFARNSTMLISVTLSAVSFVVANAIF